MTYDATHSLPTWWSRKLREGHTRLPNALLEYVCQLGLSGSCMRVLLATLRHTLGFRRHSCFYTTHKLAEWSGVSHRSAQSALQSLVDNGLVEVVDQPSRTQRGVLSVLPLLEVAGEGM